MKPARTLAFTLVVVAAVAATATAAGQQTATVSAPAHRLRPPPRTVTVIGTGDFLSEDVVNRAAANAATNGERYDYAALMSDIAPIVQWADLAICHMEVPITGPGGGGGYSGTSGGFNKVSAPYEAAVSMARVGFDRCTTASNHSWDLGAAGVVSTLDALDAAGLSHAGTARRDTEAGIELVDVRGVRVANESYTLTSNLGWPSQAWMLSRAVSAARIADDVRTARAAGAELVVVSLHTLAEFGTGPTAADRALVTALTAQARVDAVIMHGPHVVQPVERVNGTLVYWSTGNLISAMGVAGRGKFSEPRTLDGLLAAVRFTERADGTWASEEWPVLICVTTDTRRVYAAQTALHDPTLPASLRRQLEACVTRTEPVVAGTH